MYDIIIVGGGISGSIAAIAASRKGSKTLLIEKNAYLGGALTAAGVGPMMTFHAGRKLIIKGITNELIQRLVVKGKSPGHILDTTGYTYSVTPFEAESMKVELENMIYEAGGEILYHTMLASVKVENQKITSITICNKEGLTTVEGLCFIDATGDGDLSAWAGVQCFKGREEDSITQPMTLNVKMNHVNIEQIKEYMRDHPEIYEDRLELLDKSPRLSIGGFRELVDKGKAHGFLPHNIKGSILLFETDKPGEVILNCTRIAGRDSTDPISLSLAESEGRREVEELLEFLPKYMPGFKEARVMYSGPSIGVRSSRQIKGHYTIEAEDLVMSKTFVDTIAHSAYPIDIHSSEGTGGETIKMPAGSYYNIPFSSMTNPVVDNLITVGRCISATFKAQGAIRVSPTAGAIGHAGGIGAWLYVEEGRNSVKEINIKRLQKVIEEQDAYINLNEVIDDKLEVLYE